ncbi:hypothetical protein ES703_47250 [subsurface metagenome]
MRQEDFYYKINKFKAGDQIKLLCRGNYGDYRAEGTFIKVEHGYIYLTKGKAHHWSRVVTIQKKEKQKP